MTISPIYIPSRGRATMTLTPALFQADGVPFKIVVEPREQAAYAAEFGKDSIVVLDKNDQGIAYARSWMKRHSRKKGERFHWQFDDNIRQFMKLNEKRKRVRVTPSFCLTEAEAVVHRFRNVAAAALAYTRFSWSARRPVDVNKQVASGMIINNAIPQEWRRGTSADTDFSMQVLIAGFCTLLFNRLLIDKIETMKMPGGCTEIEYANAGRVKRSLALIKAWPGCFTMKGDHIAPSRIWRRFTTPLEPAR